MNIIDISMAIHDKMATYKGRKENLPQLIQRLRMPEDRINESSILMSLHTGTHMDSPRHMTVDGWTMEDMPLKPLLGPCRVLDLTRVEDAVTREDLEGYAIQKDEFILLKTQNSFGLAYREDFIYIRKDAAEYLAGIGIRGIGTDALGVERDQQGHPTHLAFMNQGVQILEGLDLSQAEEGSYTLVVLPLKITGAEGAPARAVLLDGHL